MYHLQPIRRSSSMEISLNWVIPKRSLKNVISTFFLASFFMSWFDKFVWTGRVCMHIEINESTFTAYISLHSIGICLEFLNPFIAPVDRLVIECTRLKDFCRKSIETLKWLNWFTFTHSSRRFTSLLWKMCDSTVSKIRFLYYNNYKIRSIEH